MTDEPGRIFREAWIAGVHRHYPGDPKPGYVAPWDETPGWERKAAAGVYALIRNFLTSTEDAATKLSRRQKSQFVAAAWTAQIFLRFDEPKPSYTADWEDLPEWQQETDADIFEAVESALGRGEG